MCGKHSVCGFSICTIHTLRKCVESTLYVVPDKGELWPETSMGLSFIRRGVGCALRKVSEISVGGKSHKCPALMESGPQPLLPLSSYLGIMFMVRPVDERVTPVTKDIW